MSYSTTDALRRCAPALLWLGLSAGAIAAESTAAPRPPALSAAESDPLKLQWMQGFPPPAERVIGQPDSNFFSFPKMRWTVCHFRELLPTRQVSRGLGPIRALPRAIDAGIDAVSFQPTGSDRSMTWRESLEANYTDGLVILHKGRIVYEHYAGCLREDGQHGAMSVTKSVTGLLAEILVAEGKLDPTARVDSLVPELAGSAFGDASLRQLMDMTTALDYSEDYADPKADVWIYSAAASPLPKPADYVGPVGYFDYLRTVRKAGEHGETFGYKTVNTDALGWVVARASGQSVSDLASTRLWRRLGMEQDAYYTVDSLGTPFAGGGLSAGLRDLARLGQAVLDEGRVEGEQIFPAQAVRSLRAGGDREAFARAGYAALAGGSYRSMWWVFHNPHGAFAAHGVHGQTLYIDPTARMVIARFASHPVAGNSANDPTSLPAYQAVAEYLMQASR
jgi:CubicO group peptidase (beta-lactamase class C family)